MPKTLLDLRGINSIEDIIVVALENGIQYAVSGHMGPEPENFIVTTVTENEVNRIQLSLVDEIQMLTDRLVNASKELQIVNEVDRQIQDLKPPEGTEPGTEPDTAP